MEAKNLPKNRQNEPKIRRHCVTLEKCRGHHERAISKASKSRLSQLPSAATAAPPPTPLHIDFKCLKPARNKVTSVFKLAALLLGKLRFLESRLVGLSQILYGQYHILELFWSYLGAICFRTENQIFFVGKRSR